MRDAENLIGGNMEVLALIQMVKVDFAMITTLVVVVVVFIVTDGELMSVMDLSSLMVVMLF